MASVMHITVSVQSVDTSGTRSHNFIVHDQTLAKEAIWTWIQTAITELETETLPSDRQLI